MITERYWLLLGFKGPYFAPRTPKKILVGLGTINPQEVYMALSREKLALLSSSIRKESPW